MCVINTLMGENVFYNSMCFKKAIYYTKNGKNNSILIIRNPFGRQFSSSPIRVLIMLYGRVKGDVVTIICNLWHRITLYGYYEGFVVWKVFQKWVFFVVYNVCFAWRTKQNLFVEICVTIYVWKWIIQIHICSKP